MGIGDDLREFAKKKIEAIKPNKERLDLSKSRCDLTTFVGRYKHFFAVCNPLNLLKTDSQLQYAKDVVTRYKKGENFPDLTEDDLWKQQILYESAFHPVTGEKMFVFGRMAAQAPTNMFLMGAMICFYKRKSEVIFWQWVNQSYNAVVNYTNSSDPSGASLNDSLKNYCAAVSLAVLASLYFNNLASKAGRLASRLVPFGATSVSNAINIPLVRQKELTEGIQLWHEGKPVAKSRTMGALAISEVTVSRIAMAIPHLVLIPILMNQLVRIKFLNRFKNIAIPFQFIACGTLLLFGTPLGCALFPQKVYVPVTYLGSETQEKLKKLPNPASEVYFNKGL